MTEAYDRAIARETRIWVPFVHSFLFSDGQNIERNIIFGLYANSALNTGKYLIEVEAEDLANILADYNAKIADLTAKEALVAKEIISRRYLASIDKIIHDKKLDTKRANIDADDDIWDAKIAALSADQAALATMAAKVSTETQKTTAKITEMEAYIEIEALRLTEADIEVVQKEIQSAKVDIEKLDTQNQILKIQIDTVEAAQTLVDVDVRIARTQIGNAEIDRQSNKIDLLDSELTIEQAKTYIAEAEIPVAEARVALANSRKEGILSEIDHLATESAQAQMDYEGKINLMDIRQAGKYEAVTMRREEANTNIDNRLNVSALEIDLAEKDGDLQALLDNARIQEMYNDASNYWTLSQGRINAEKTKAAAKIGTELTHTIVKK